MGNINEAGQQDLGGHDSLSTPYGKHKPADERARDQGKAAFYSLWET